MKLKKLKDLYFGVCVWDSFKKEIEVRNLFSSSGILWSVALYRTGKMDEFLRSDFARDTGRTYEEEFAWWCFSDTWSRIQWESGFGEPFKNEDGTWDGVKTDVFNLYVLPNKTLLKEMVDSISKNSCVQYLREERKRRKENKNALRSICN